MSKERKQSTEAAVREISRRTRRKFSPEEKVRIVFEGLHGEQSVSELCRREGTPNPLAPCPENWPGFFEVFTRKQRFHFGSESIAAYIREAASDSPDAPIEVSPST